MIKTNNAPRNGQAEASPKPDDVDPGPLVIVSSIYDDASPKRLGLDCKPSTMCAVSDCVNGREVVVLAKDNDEDKKRASVDVARALAAGAAAARVVVVPGWGSCYKSLTDWCSDHDLLAAIAGKPAVSGSIAAQAPGSGQNGPSKQNGNPIANGKHESADGSLGSQGISGVPPVIFVGDPKPLKIELRLVPKFEPKMIPASLRTWIEDIAERGCFPVEYPAAALIVGLSGLVGRQLAIRPKRMDNDWLEVPNLWGAVVGPPGVQKTPSIEEALRPLRRLEAAAIDQHARELSSHAERQMLAAARKDAAQKKLQSEARKPGITDEGLADFVREAAAAVDEKAPEPKRFLVADTTIEKLGELLRANPNGLTLLRDELTGFLRTLDKQGHESDRAFYLQAWNGNGAFTFDRIGRGTVHIRGVCLAVFGTIQPGPLQSYIRGMTSGKEADGLIARFQILVYPDLPPKFVNVDRAPKAGAKHDAFKIFEWLSNLDPGSLGCAYHEDKGIHYVGFDNAAQAFFDQWRENLENRLRSGALPPMSAAHLSKYRSLMPSLALLFHVVECRGKTKLPDVSKKAAMQAAVWCELLESHLQRIFGAVEANIDDAIRLAERLGSLPNPFTAWQVAQKAWSGLSAVEDVNRAIATLEDHRWVKAVDIPPGAKGGRPSRQIWVHTKAPIQKGGGQ